MGAGLPGRNERSDAAGLAPDSPIVADRDTGAELLLLGPDRLRATIGSPPRASGELIELCDCGSHASPKEQDHIRAVALLVYVAETVLLERQSSCHVRARSRQHARSASFECRPSRRRRHPPDLPLSVSQVRVRERRSFERIQEVARSR